MIEVLVDAVLDSLLVLPFLFVVYVLIEFIEKRLMFASRAKRLLRGKYAPLIGVGVGLIPQCGFSVMATNLYLSKNLTIGTLIAVFIATSDEAIPILLSNGATALKLLPLLGIKILFALFMGYLLDVIFRKRNAETLSLSADTTTVSMQGAKESADSEKAIAKEESEEETGCCRHVLEKSGKIDKKDWYKNYLFHPLIHSLKVFFYILLINFAFGTLIYFVGQDRISVFLAQSGWWQPFIAGLVGLIPNCAASVIISQLYVLGGLTFGSCVTGLSINAGIAMALLFRKNSNIKDSIFILAVLYLSSVLLGVMLTPIPW